MTSVLKTLSCCGLLLMAGACGIQPLPPTATFPDSTSDPALLPAQPDWIDIDHVVIDPPIELEAEPAFEMAAEPVSLEPASYQLDF